MKKSLAPSVLALALTYGAPVLAAGETPAPAPTPLAKSGTITAWDGAAHTVTIKTASGKSLSFHWDGKTRVRGIAKLGEHVTIASTKDKDGEAMATLIEVDAKPAPTKTSTHK